jgi:hypothetical protein
LTGFPGEGRLLKNKLPINVLFAKFGSLAMLAT